MFKTWYEVGKLLHGRVGGIFLIYVEQMRAVKDMLNVYTSIMFLLGIVNHKQFIVSFAFRLKSVPLVILLGFGTLVYRYCTFSFYGLCL